MRTEVIVAIVLLVHLRLNLKLAQVLKNDAENQLSKRTQQMLSFMNQSVDPCENFYEFTCGKWASQYSAQNDKSKISTHYLRTIVEAFDKKIIEILREKIDPNDTEYDKEVKKYYRSCMSLENGIDAKRMIRLMEEIGEMPLLAKTADEWNEKNFDWIDTLGRIKRKYGYQIIIGLGVAPDMFDNSTHRVYIGEADFELETKTVYLEPIGEQYRDAHRTEIAVKLHKLLGVELEKTVKVAAEILDFEIELARGMQDFQTVQSLDELLTKTTAEELQAQYGPTIDVKRLFQMIFGEIPSDIIYEYRLGYLENVKNVIENTDKRIIANYLFYHVLHKFDIRTDLLLEEREKDCLKTTKKEFYAKIDNMFYRRFIDNETLLGIEEIWQKLKDTFEAKLKDNKTMTWMINETREKALEKLKALKLHLNTYDDRDFKYDFDNLTLSENDFVGNLHQITELNANRSFSKLHEPIASWDLGEEISKSPINFQVGNTVYVPVFMLQSHFLWAADYPAALKFSMIGFLLAHELIHTFDDEGRQFGVTGNLVNWWDDDSTQKFLERRDYFADQYHRYRYGKAFLPKTERQSENIADNGGLKLAYDAFIKHTVDGNVERHFPGFNYTMKQLFFIGFGQIWCSDVNKFYLNYQVATDNHTPDRLRNIVTVTNSLDFAEAFNCTVGSKMNPQNKCRIY